jgi:nucleoid DNA-binding protein
LGNITKQDLVQRAASQSRVSQAKVRQVMDEFLLVVGEDLQAGQTIEIRGFGTFHSRKRQPRPARNPRTGEVVALGERMVPLFKFSNELRLGDAPKAEWELAGASN